MSRKILITNDDGIHSSGIIRLARAAQKYGEVYVVAPESQRSAASHSISLRNSIDVYDAEFPVPGVKAYAISGTPADCVRLGVLHILPEKPDVVLSGINFGYNAGTDTQYSATVGAAMEAVFQGIPAIALSEGTNEGMEMLTDRYLEQVLDEVIDEPWVDREIININFPGCKPEDFKGIQRGVFNSRSTIFEDRYSCEEVEPGHRRYMVAGSYQEVAEEGSDLYALFHGYIAIGKLKNIC